MPSFCSFVTMFSVTAFDAYVLAAASSAIFMAVRMRIVRTSNRLSNLDQANRDETQLTDEEGILIRLHCNRLRRDRLAVPRDNSIQNAGVHADQKERRLRKLTGDVRAVRRNK